MQCRLNYPKQSEPFYRKRYKGPQTALGVPQVQRLYSTSQLSSTDPRRSPQSSVVLRSLPQSSAVLRSLPQKICRFGFRTNTHPTHSSRFDPIVQNNGKSLKVEYASLTVEWRAVPTIMTWEDFDHFKSVFEVVVVTAGGTVVAVMKRAVIVRAFWKIVRDTANQTDRDVARQGLNEAGPAGQVAITQLTGELRRHGDEDGAQRLEHEMQANIA